MLIEIYDPPMCCSSGLCGPDVDDNLLNINELILELKDKGAEVKRYLINQQPKKFTERQDIVDLLNEEGVDILPITVIDGEIVKKNEYPDKETFFNKLNL